MHAIGGFGLTINGGTVQLGGTGGDQIYDGANVSMNGGTLDTNGNSEAFAALNVGGFGALVNNAAGTSSTLTPTSVVLSSDALMGAASSANLIVNTPISGNHSLEITSANTGTLALNGNNSYTGVTDVFGGTLDIPTIANGGLSSPIGASSNATTNLQLGFLGRGTLMLTGANAAYSTDRGVTLNGSYYNALGGAIGVQNYGTTLTWNGQITGSGSLIKTGAGTLTLTNTSNNYTGSTFVEEGTLVTPAVPPEGGFIKQTIPYASGVTVFPGATYQVTSAASNNNIYLSAVALNGGTLGVDHATLYIESLASNTAGSTVNLTNNGSLIITVLGFGGEVVATINANTTWTSDNNSTFVYNDAEYPIGLVVAPGATLTNSIFLSSDGHGTSQPFLISGGGTVYMTAQSHGTPVGYIVYQGRLRADDLSVAADGSSVLGLAQTSFLTLDGGILQYSGPTATSPMPITVTANGGTLEVSNAATTLTYTGTLSGFGPLIKNGPGVLTLNNLANSYASGITVSGGRIDVSDDAQLGAATVTVNPAGTLRYTADATTTRTFNLAGGKLEAPAGVTLTLSGAAVNGGFLRGAGSFVVTGGATLSAATTLNGTTINQTGPASYTDFTNGGTLNVAANLADPPSFDGFTNQGSGAVIVGANAKVSVADFQSYGTFALAPGTGGGFTQVTNAGGAPLFFNGGSRTYIGSAAAPNPQTAKLSANVELNGALLVNNGTVDGTVDVNYGSLAKGAGVYGVVNVFEGGTFSPGNSPGIVTASTVTFDRSPVTSGSPTLLVELGGTTPGAGYDQLHVTGQLSLAGLLQVVLVPGFMPGSGNSFDLLDWGSLAGTFSSISLPALTAGLTWNTSQLYTTGVLSVTSAGIPGDYNNNGVVDAADYVVWRANQGTNNVPAERPHRRHDRSWPSLTSGGASFGQTVGGGSGLSADAAVPEPATLLLAGVGLAAISKILLRRAAPLNLFAPRIR